jgi:hypothetical protein
MSLRHRALSAHRGIGRDSAPAHGFRGDSLVYFPNITRGRKALLLAGDFRVAAADGRDMAFMVDDNTDVLARGAGRATRNACGSLPIADLVHNGDLVRVAYRELNGWMRASEIHIRGRNTIAAR